MKSNFHEISIQDFHKVFPESTSSKIAEQVFISNVRHNEHFEQTLKTLSEPWRFDGHMAILCSKGSMDVEVNLKTYRITGKSVMIYVPGNIVRISRFDYDHMEDFEFAVVAVSNSFMSTAKMDFAALFDKSISLMDSPCFELNDDEYEICRKYYSLSRTLFLSETPEIKYSIYSLLASIFHFLGAIWKKDLADGEFSSPSGTMRSKRIFDSFIKLVKENHNSERNVGFYADKLCLTPKYLSKLIRSVSGKSAPEWIDSFVILEAKNMLKHSSMSIKEIVYLLGFQNQSVFYKFFKAQTGMTPTEYRAS